MLGIITSTAQAAPVSVPFTGNDTWTAPADASQVDILVVGAGGGGGGGANSGGGGGGGEVKVCTAVAVGPGQALAVTVGTGGAPSASLDGKQNGADGTSSSVSVGGTPVCSGNGGQGGLGFEYSGGASGNLISGGSGGVFAGGGGGGAAGGGGNSNFDGTNHFGGAGGAGLEPDSLPTPGLFSGETTPYGGGGGGGGTGSPPAGGTGGVGGSGGGGDGSTSTSPPSNPTPGAANSGGGGGGRAGSSLASNGFGGSGYVELRYVPIPLNTSQPSVSGSDLVGSNVSTTNGSWNNSPTGYTYTWQRCDDTAGTGCVDIGGAATASYTSTSADVGKYLRSRVTATNFGGETSAFSSNYLLVRTPAPDPPGPPGTDPP